MINNTSFEFNKTLRRRRKIRAAVKNQKRDSHTQELARALVKTYSNKINSARVLEKTEELGRFFDHLFEN